jgi:RNA polymerase subunit RPABC4/transcription elongation factor Spt4
MAIKVTCPNGHTLRVNDSLAGKTGLCPTCKARVTVPELKQEAIDESDILQVIGPYDPDKSQVVRRDSRLDGEAEEKKSKVEMRRCMSCEREIEAETHICPYCHHYIGGVGDFG